MKRRSLLKSAVIGLAAMTLPVSAMAMDTVRVAFLKIPPLVPMIHAQEAGIFAKNGLQVALTVVNAPPELMMALASSSVDINMDAVGGALIARAKGLKIKAIGTIDPEAPDDIRNWIVTTEASGIKSPADLEGKIVGIVAKGSPAEMTIRSHVLNAGGDPDKVKFVALPFPQLPAALEVGNVDAIHVGEPFHGQIMHSDKVKAVEIGEGLLANMQGTVALGGFFAQEDWLADEKNRDIAARFLKSVIESNRELDADRSLVNAILEKDFGMPAEVAAHIPMPFTTDTIVADPAAYAPTIAELAKVGMIPAEYPVEDVVEVIEYENK